MVCQPDLRRFARRACSSGEDAEDAVQIALWQLYRKIGALRAAATGTGLSNVVNNLPAYVAGESVIPFSHHTQLLALLIGTNVGPIITPWASLATLLWYERCRAYDVAVPPRKFMLTGACLAVCGVAAAVGALLVTG